VKCRVRADAACSRERSAAVRGYFDHEPGFLASAAEVWRLDGRTGRPVLAEPLGPDLVEHRPVTLKIPHDDANPHHVGQRRAGGGQDRLEVGEDLFRLSPCVLGDGVVQRVGPNNADTWIQPPASTACGTGPVCDGAPSVWMIRTKPPGWDENSAADTVGAASTVRAAALPGHHQQSDTIVVSNDHRRHHQASQNESRPGYWSGRLSPDS
jgi:hypothetical protein